MHAHYDLSRFERAAIRNFNELIPVSGSLGDERSFLCVNEVQIPCNYSNTAITSDLALGGRPFSITNVT
jgi:hypothetical protein